MSQGTKKIHKVLQALYADYSLSMMLLSAFDALISYLALTLAFLVLDVGKYFTPLFYIPSSIYVPVLLTVVIFMILSIIRVTRYSIPYIEEKVEPMRDMLSIARETMREDDFVIDQFRKDFLSTARGSSSGSLLPFRRLVRRIGICTALILLLLTQSFIAPTLSILPEELPNILPKFLPKIKEVDDHREFELKRAYSIYGEATDVATGDDTLAFQVDAASTRGDLSHPLAWQNELSDISVGERRAEVFGSSPAIEELPVEYDLAKAYNLKIRQLVT